MSRCNWNYPESRAFLLRVPLKLVMDSSQSHEMSVESAFSMLKNPIKASSFKSPMICSSELNYSEQIEVVLT